MQNASLLPVALLFKSTYLRLPGVCYNVKQTNQSHNYPHLLFATVCFLEVFCDRSVAFISVSKALLTALECKQHHYGCSSHSFRALPIEGDISKNTPHVFEEDWLQSIQDKGKGSCLESRLHDNASSTDFTFPLARWAPMQPATIDPM